MIFMGLVGGIGHYCIIKAFTLGEASAIAPYSYIGIVFATFWGMLLFNEFPDAATYFGALVIIAAGLYVWWRETKISHRT
jgi:drug/metabolite transporter (DMT)-like permease